MFFTVCFGELKMELRPERNIVDHANLGNQLECEFGGDRYFGVLADMDFILISTYEAEGTNPELVLYKKR